jgi:hypothetical protein
MTKNIVLWLPFAFVVGGLVGAWGPSEELRAFKSRSEKNEQSAKKVQGFDAFSKMMNIPDVAKRRRSSGSRAAGAGVKEKAPQRADGSSGAETARTEPAPRRLNPEDLRARIEEASELWRTRSELVLANAVKKLGFDAAGEARFEEILVQMNDAIRSSVQAIADALAAEEEMTPELGVRLMGDLSATMAETYDLIGECAGKELRGEVSRLNLADFVDPSVAEPLIGVQHKLNAFPMRRMGR